MTNAVSLAQQASTGVSQGFKNRIINGAMVIDQRNAGASVTATGSSGQFTLDRWKIYYSQNSKFTVQQNAGSVTPPVGFINYAGITSSSAYTVGSGELFLFTQPIEGLNVADLGWGTANAKTVTLSFQVRSSLIGTFGGAIGNSANNRSYPFSYTISSANTWTSVSITIAGDTSGTWLTTNGVGMYIHFGLGVGSTYSGTAGAWAGAEYYSATGATSVVGTNGATWYVTGVQLEVGSSATSFEYRPYGTELNLCLRYYYMMNPATQGSWGSGNSFSTGYTFAGNDGMTFYMALPVPMRVTPTNLTISAASTWSAVIASVATPTAVACGGTSPYNATFSLTGGGCGFGSSGLAGRIRVNSSNTFADFSAEL